MEALTELSLFSGGGGGLLGTTHLLGWRTVCYVEWDEYAIEILKARIRDGYLHDAPIWDDAFTFDGRPWTGLVDIITAGFPCQPFSKAGKGLAENDPRNGWPAVIRIIREVRPRYALLENVTNLLTKPYIRRIYGDLAEAGYSVEQDCIAASEVGAPHKRDRLWILATSADPFREMADADSIRRVHRKAEKHTAETRQHAQREFIPGSSDVHIPFSTRLEGIRDGRKTEGQAGLFSGTWTNEKKDLAKARSEWWTVEPELGRVANGVANRVDRLRATGNGQVPGVVAEAWRRLSGE